MINKYKLKLLKWNLSKKFSGNLLAKTKWFNLKVSSLDDALSKEIYLHGEYSFKEIDKAVDFLKSKNKFINGTLLDIGANIGHVTYYFLARGYSNNAICFEPDKLNFGLLKYNSKLNKREQNVDLYNFALGGITGKTKFILSQDNLGDHRIYTENESTQIDKYNANQNRSIIDVDIYKLDEVLPKSKFEKNISFICIDVQGFEFEIFKGATNLLKRGIPIMMELDPYLLDKKGTSIYELTDFLKTYYSRFINIHAEPISNHPIEELTQTFNTIASSNSHYTDILLYNE